MRGGSRSGPKVDILTEQWQGDGVVTAALSNVGPLKGWENLDCRIPLGVKFGCGRSRGERREAWAPGSGAALPKSVVEEATRLEGVRGGQRAAPSLAQSRQSTIVYGRGQTLYARRPREKSSRRQTGGWWGWGIGNAETRRNKTGRRPTSSRTRGRDGQTGQGRVLGEQGTRYVSKVINSVGTGRAPEGEGVCVSIPRVRTVQYVQGRERIGRDWNEYVYLLEGGLGVGDLCGWG